MAATDCKRYESCSAPFCPMNEGSLGGIWFPEEEICRSREFSQEAWIKRQKMIAKKTGDIYPGYTYEMLQRDCIIKKGIVGIDPDIPIDEFDEAVQKWLEAHPEKKPMSEEKKAEFAKRMRESRNR